MSREQVFVGDYQYRCGIARKEGPCQYGITANGDRSSRCMVVIKAGDRFIYGELDQNSKAMGFAQQRWCMVHAAKERAP